VFKLGILEYDIPTGFITRWTVAGDAAARTITLPLVNTRAEGALGYNCTVSWGDGTPDSVITAYNDVDRIHTYAIDGTYDVEIRGTCEGWSFNNAGDRLKIVKVVNWGNLSLFNGWKYLKGGFYGCTNLTSLGLGVILASGTGILTDGFYQIFRGCTSLTTVPTDLFRYNPSVTTNAFYLAFYGCSSLITIPTDLFRYNVAASSSGFGSTFFGCSSLASIPVDLFRYNPSVSTDGFKQTFYGCSSLTSIPTDLFRYNPSVTTEGFSETFRGCTSITTVPTDLFRYNAAVTTLGFLRTFYGCTSLTTLPTDLFRYNIAVSSQGFNSTFFGCISLVSIPTDLFRYNTAISSEGFSQTFYGCSSLVTVPTDLFRYNVAVTTNGFFETFRDCTSLTSVPADLFRYNVAVSTQGFLRTFYGCIKLQLNRNIFYADGEQGTRFLNRPSDFTRCFQRTSFTGLQGTAPDLWECDYGETITLDVAPVTDWVANDLITGQSSGATAVVVSKVSALVYKIKKHYGTFALGEIVGVTGDPNKLADQGPTRPTFAGRPTATDCYDGAGNSLVSLDNYAQIPATWL